MTGHAPEPTLRAIAEQAAKGLTLMLPSEDALVVSEDLTRRFGVCSWQFALTATDANRLDPARAPPHATDEGPRLRLVLPRDGRRGLRDARGRGRSRAERQSRAPVDPAETTRVVQFNDGLERELAHRDVAVVLTEPALTNVGIVHPEPGFHDALRELTRSHGSLLAIDETHTICCGPGGYTAAHGLEPDVVTIGKPIAGGLGGGLRLLPGRCVAARGTIELEDVDVGGVGGTLAANALCSRRCGRHSARC